MERLPTCPLLISVLTITAVLGCGVMPPGQTRSRNFTVTGFTLPVNMVYSTDASVRIKAFGIAESKDAVRASVSRLMMQTVFDVLEQQGRSALLPDTIILNILGQLMVQTRYEPLECKEASVNQPPANKITVKMVPHCIIVDSTVTALCDAMPGAAQQMDMCDISKNERITAVSNTPISESLTLTFPQFRLNQIPDES
ncbi:hypothetical protein KIN20_032477 [Parelaphostrongylus tenuis]|uniref:Uncharacterized protein n=1 Tax=Parelaphostrongylus tenuis TaxID=148309 RepID=A0AAD5R6Y2_PARTN|nr:hypothetical protein KIN20_032477 [Parelaphostrongylus tenuis]